LCRDEEISHWQRKGGKGERADVACLETWRLDGPGARRGMLGCVDCPTQVLCGFGFWREKAVGEGPRAARADERPVMVVVEPVMEVEGRSECRHHRWDQDVSDKAVVDEGLSGWLASRKMVDDPKGMELELDASNLGAGRMRYWGQRRGGRGKGGKM
jgi:hypothetical protein